MLSLSEASVLGSPGGNGARGAGLVFSSAEARLASEKDAVAAVPRKVRRGTGSGDISGDGIYHLAFLIEKLEAGKSLFRDPEKRPPRVPPIPDPGHGIL